MLHKPLIFFPISINEIDPAYIAPAGKLTQFTFDFADPLAIAIEGGEEI